MTPPEARIRREIADHNGAIPFSRFMELALYSTEGGYYETHERTIGRRGDFFTSVSVGDVFGQILGTRFAACLGQLGEGPLGIVEAGAHDGRLAADILGWLASHAPELFPRLTYTLVEPSPVRRGWQQERLAPWGSRIAWVEGIGQVPDGVRGILFSNELLDALPVHPLAWSVPDRGWRERGVGVSPSGDLAWVLLPRDPSRIDQLFREAHLADPTELHGVLPDGYILELCPAAAAWWKGVAERLAEGWIVGIDYGMSMEELLRPERTGGTLRAYSHHRVSDNVLADPGSQDLTAHVNFTSIEAAGMALGLVTEGLSRQGEYLVRAVDAAVRRGVEFPWTPAQRRQFQTLVHPQHLGHSFRVLEQRRRGPG
ncbi:MAG TPA: hypothetical protein DCM86_12770 [Verrucomicrobiales bacterium]|nr:hypothetical protein [Verrucomicrobiales bacterium]